MSNITFDTLKCIIYHGEISHLNSYKKPQKEQLQEIILKNFEKYLLVE